MTAQINFCMVAHHNDIIYVYRQNISKYSDHTAYTCSVIMNILFHNQVHQHDIIQHLY